MSHNLKENDEDISNLDVFDDNKDNIDKISKDEGSAVTDLEPSEDNEKNGSGQKIVQEESATEHKNVGGADVQDEEQKGIEEGKDEQGKDEESDPTSTSTSTAITNVATAATTDDTTTTTADAPAAPSLVPPSPMSDSKFYASSLN